ncbi:MAG: hypothetical protein HOM80_05930, partial [Bacteroidetes bacterium]|nr:hypothetical protein [Bacteroidota bacterium]
MKTNSLFLVLSFSLILLFTANEMSAQIYSTSNGGNWHNPQTWIGGTIPDGSNSVVITSVVSVDNTAFCNNLTVQPNGTLQNTGGSHTINVYGHASNSGIIQNYVNSLIMYVHGNITNSGVWSIHNTCLSGSADQTVGTYGGHIFTGANFTDNEVSSQVIADTDLVFDGTHIDLNFSNLILPAGYRISVSGSGVAFRDANIYGDNSILEMSAGTKIYFINGYNLIMQGTISIDDNNSHFHNYLI